MEQIIFVTIVVVIGVIRLITQLAENKKTSDAAKSASPSPAQPSSPLAPRGAPQTEEERVRKFLEALGVPTSKDPPSKVQPQPVRPTTSPKRKILPVDPFPKPRGQTIQPSPPPTATPPPLPSMPAPLREELPTRRKTVLADASDAERRVARMDAEFGVRDIDEAIAENVLSHAGLPIDGRKAQVIAPGSVVARLASPEGLRDAIILREIFGPPRSLQAMERPIGG